MDLSHLEDQLEESIAAIRARWSRTPLSAVILGTGLGRFAAEIEAEAVLDYEAIPHFPRATAPGHRGQLVCGLLGQTPVVAMEGRFHAYEGYSLAETTFPVRVLRRLGVERLVVSNASGGLNPNFQLGDVVVVEDHINLMQTNPLVGINDPAAGPRWPDLSRPYDAELANQALEIARRAGIPAHRGVYVALAGPNYETRAEYRLLRRIGGDVVGMSTVPEVIVAASIGLRVLALSTVTNVCRPDALGPTSGAAVVAAAEAAGPRVAEIVRGVVGG